MSNGNVKGNVENSSDEAIVERLFKLEAMINKLILDGRRDSVVVINAVQEIVGKEVAVFKKHNIYCKLWSHWTWLNWMVMMGDKRPEKVADALQKIVDQSDDRLGLITLDSAIRILGADKVISADAEAKAWGRTEVVNAPIRYTEATLRQAAQENVAGFTDWRLVYVNGELLRRLREIVGTDKKQQPCFSEYSTWWLADKEDLWATKQAEGAYYLLDLKPRWGGMNWDCQEVELKKLGDKFERADPAVFTKAAITIFQNSGEREERIAKDWVHWSGVAASGGYFVFVGHFGTDGWLVYGVHRGRSGSGLRVVVFRKFDA